MAGSRELKHLNGAFATKVRTVLKGCKGAGFELRPFSTLRTPWDQARLFRRGRSKEQIKKEVNILKEAGAPYLAKVLEGVGPQSDLGGIVTNNLPGESWHNFGLACDCFVFSRGRVVWTASHQGYSEFARIAKSAGLTAGIYWRRLKDPVHIQLPKEPSPHMAKSWPKINDELHGSFGGREKRIT